MAHLLTCCSQQDQLLTEDEVIAALPPWTSQITVRALCVGGILGAVFSFITMRFSLGPGGVVPTFNMPIGALELLPALQHLCSSADCIRGLYDLVALPVLCFGPCQLLMVIPCSNAAMSSTSDTAAAASLSR